MNCTKSMWRCFLPALAAIAVATMMPRAAQAAITLSGDCVPSTTVDWTTGDHDLVAGSNSSATVMIDNGSIADGMWSIIGRLPGSSGTVTITGSSSTWHSANDHGGRIGREGSGVLVVANGGAYSNYGYDDTRIGGDYGRLGAGTVTVTGSDSQFYTSSGLTVGYAGTGEFNLLDGASYVNDGWTAVIGYYDGFYSGVGIATVSGSSTWANNGSAWLTVGSGYGTSGQLTINSGGTVTAANDIVIANTDGASGTITVDGSGSYLYGSNNLEIGLNASGQFGFGRLQIQNGASIQIGAVSTASGAGVVAFGTGGGTIHATDFLPKVATSVYGTGDVYMHGIIVDADTTYDTSTGNQAAWDATSANGGTVSFDLNMGDSARRGDLGVSGNHSLTIDGITVYSQHGIAGYGLGTGSITVSGGANWDVASDLDVGNYSSSDTSNNGVLKITNGTVSSGAGWIGAGGNGGAAGTVTVDGSNAAWIGAETRVGNASGGVGMLIIQNGATMVSSGNQSWIGSNANGTVTVDGSGSSWTVDGLVVGDRSGATGVLNITNQATVTSTDAVKIGNSDGTGMVNFGSNGGTLTAQSLYGVSSQVTGTGTINTQGFMGNAALVFDSTSGPIATLAWGGVTVNVNMSNTDTSGDLGVGYFPGGSGSLAISGGNVIHSYRGYIGYYDSTTASATVSGPDSEWNVDYEFALGYKGDDIQSTLTIENGGHLKVNNRSCYIGHYNTNRGSANITIQSGGSLTYNTGSSYDSFYLGYSRDGTATMTVTGAGSAFLSTRELRVAPGTDSSGTLTVENDGTVQCSNLVIGRGTNSTATVDITNGLVATTGNTRIGYSSGSTGNLNLNAGGTLSSNQVYNNTSSGTGTVNFDGGMLQAYNASQADWLKSETSSGGVLNAYVKENGAKFDTNGYDMGIAMVLQHSGGTNTDGGITKLGDGTLTLSGDNTYDGLTSVTGGVLKLVDATSDWSGAFAPIFTGGSASVGGGKLLFNYDSTYDDATALSNVQSAISSGTIFAAYHAAPLLCSGSTATDTVTVMNTLFGDSNVDGSVNGTDLNAVLSNYNQSGQVWANGDFNFDGSVNGTDLNTVLSNYNQSVSFASTAAVPEPSTLVLMVLGLVGLLVWRRRK